jgi:hypothetical protein
MPEWKLKDALCHGYRRRRYERIRIPFDVLLS